MFRAPQAGDWAADDVEDDTPAVQQAPRPNAWAREPVSSAGSAADPPPANRWETFRREQREQQEQPQPQRNQRDYREQGRDQRDSRDQGRDYRDQGRDQGRDYRDRRDYRDERRAPRQQQNDPIERGIVVAIKESFGFVR